MELINIFTILFTVVLFCSWAYLIWSTWKGKSAFVKFPPYGMDVCPFGFDLTSDGNTCSRIPDYPTGSAVEKIGGSQDICDVYDKSGGTPDVFYDGVPIKGKSHLKTTNVEDLSNKCCDSNRKLVSCKMDSDNAKNFALLRGVSHNT